MKNWYLGLSYGKKQMLWLLIIAIVGVIATLPFCFLDIPAGYSYLCGWLLGSVVEMFGYASILWMGGAMMASAQNEQTGTAKALAPLSATLRFLFYAAALIISGICTFRSEWFGGFNAFNFWTCFGALVPMNIVVLVFHLVHKEHPTSSGSSGFEGESK